MQRRHFLSLGLTAGFASSNGLAFLAQLGEVRVRLGVMDGTLGLASNPEAAARAAAIGFENVQVALGLPANGQLALSNTALQQRWKDAAQQSRIGISATYIDVLHVNCLKNSAEAESWAREGIRITKALGAPILMLVFFGKCAVEKEEEQQAVLDPLRRLSKIAHNEGVVLALENTISAEANIRILEQVKSPALKIWYDIGNATNIGGFDIVREITLLGRNRICEFHIKDKVWLGEGKVDIDGAARAIREIGYTGICTFETVSPTRDRDADSKVQLKTFTSALKRANVLVSSRDK